MLPKQPNQSLIDGIRCLQAVVTHEEPVGISEVSRELDIECTRVHRFLRTLTHTGLLCQTASRKYQAGPALPVLAAQTLHAIGFGQRSIPHLERLRKNVGYIVAMGVLWERSVSYLYHAQSGKRLEAALGGYEIWPAIHSGIGMVLLAQKTDEEIKAEFPAAACVDYPGGAKGLLKDAAQIRKQGYAYTTTHKDHYTLAVVLGSNSYTGIGISGPIPTQDIPRLLTELRRCVAGISKNSAVSASSHPLPQAF